MKKINKIIIAAISAVILALSAMFVPACAASYGIRAEKRTEDSIRLVWEEQEGADGYRVYKYDTAQGKYVTYKTMATASCTITDLSPNTAYRFKIRSLVQDESGKYVKLTDSGAVTVKTREKVVSTPKPAAPEKDEDELFNEEVKRLQKELAEAKKQLSSAESELSSCEKKIATYKKTIETKFVSTSSTAAERAEVEKAKDGLEDERKRHTSLTNKVNVYKAKVNRLTTQLNSMGVDVF